MYTEEIKQKMDSILAAFADEIRDQPSIDIHYSEEQGFWIKGPEDGLLVRIDTPDQLVETLISGLADGVMAQRRSSPLPEAGDAKPEGNAEIYHRIMEPVKKIAEDRAHYVHLAINYYQKRFEKREDIGKSAHQKDRG